VRRNAIFARLKQDIQAQTGGVVKRGSEIPHRPAPAREVEHGNDQAAPQVQADGE
jgi:hypothetical protein